MSDKTPDILINAVFHSGTKQMAVEIQVGDMSYILSREVAELVAEDMMEAAGYCEAYENGDEELMRQIENNTLESGGRINPENLAEIREYNSADEFISDMEQQAPVTTKKTLH